MHPKCIPISVVMCKIYSQGTKCCVMECGVYSPKCIPISVVICKIYSQGTKCGVMEWCAKGLLIVHLVTL